MPNKIINVFQILKQILSSSFRLQSGNSVYNSCLNLQYERINYQKLKLGALSNIFPRWRFTYSDVG